MNRPYAKSRILEAINHASTTEKGYENLFTFLSQDLDAVNFYAAKYIIDVLPYWMSFRLLSRLAVLKNKTYNGEIYDAMFGYIRVMAEWAEVKDAVEKQENRYPYIPFDRGDFAQYIIQIKKVFDFKSFIDVGGGIGDKPMIVAGLFPTVRCVSLEYNAVTARIADHLYSHYPVVGDPFQDWWREHKEDWHVPKAICGDAFTFDGFSEYDLLYMYMPIASDRLIDLYKAVWKGMRPGACLFEVSKNVRYSAFVYNVFGEEFNKSLIYCRHILQKVDDTHANVINFNRGD